MTHCSNCTGSTVCHRHQPVGRRIGVTGGRDYGDINEVWSVFVHRIKEGDVIIEGGAKGADRLCRERAQREGYEVETHNADWGKYAKAAGFIRNQEMVDSGLDLLIAFPGGRGTADMVKRCGRAGIKILTIPAYSRTNSTKEGEE